MTANSLPGTLTPLALALANHLWQSTLVAGVVGLLTLTLRRNHARARYGLWLVASMKFLLPFSLLMILGGQLASLRHSNPVGKATAESFVTIEQISQPFTDASYQYSTERTTAESATTSNSDRLAAVWNREPLLPLVLAAAWLAGFLVVTARWTRRWRKISDAIQLTEPLREGREFEILRRMERLAGLQRSIELRSLPASMEPGIFGLFRPILLWPQAITVGLEDTHLEAVLAHEVCHVRRRDNLTAAIHMVVEAVFWFFPVVWWLETRLVEERERACDEEVLQLCGQRGVYAESILKVCEFCVESPLACVSGVTGASLKQRIVRIMTQQAGRKLDLSRKLLLCVAAVMAVALPFTFGLVHATQVSAQSAPANPAGNIAATWQGTLHTGRDIRFVVKIAKAGDGTLRAVCQFDIDAEPGDGMPAISTTLNGSLLKLELPFGTYEGTVSADGNSITGTWRRGANPQPLNFARATRETEWTIPQPPPRMPAMAADANPTFEVATIKPSRPDQRGGGFHPQGRRFSATNTSLSDLFDFAYGLQQRQILRAPDWVSSERYDMSAVPDGEGEPSWKQWQSMVGKLMVDRFHLRFHYEKRELAVYALTVAKGGPKLKVSTPASLGA
jgi:beta-lactamase regulating signal transducer with metallopeptidase domain